MTDITIGTADWSLPVGAAARFPGEGSHLERYAHQMRGVEINSSFHRSHRVETYRRWAAAVPPEFRFSVKLPKTITHKRRLIDVEALVTAFAAETAGLGDKRAIILVQLPPSLAFEPATVDAFFNLLRRTCDAALVCEPRHPTWFADDADACLADLRVARVAAHPVLAIGGERPGGWTDLCYHRLHGAPRVYYSAYQADFLADLAASITASTAAQSWCIFDNTASGAATADALALSDLLLQARTKQA